MNKQPLHIRLVKLAVVAVAFMLTLEIMARVDDWIKWDADLLAPYSADLLRTVDENGYHSNPSTVYQKWRINSFGFRGDEITKEKPDGVIRIITLGASETFGLYESDNKEMPAQLQEILNKNVAGKYQVLNAAHAGMSIPRILEYYDNWLKDFDADIILYYPTPIFYMDNYPPSYAKPSPIKHDKLILNVRVLDKTKIVIKKLLPESLQSYMREYGINKAVNSQEPGWVFEDVPDERIEVFKKQLHHLASKIDSSATKLYVATHLNSMSGEDPEIDQLNLVKARKFYPRVSNDCLLKIDDVFNKTIVQQAEEYNYKVIDLAALVPNKLEYFADFAHFTDKGAEVVAGVIAKDIVLDKD